jgi:lipopolysaccharide transport system ATP-binding protein
MSRWAIRADSLSKRYAIGDGGSRATNLKEALSDGVARLLSRAREERASRRRADAFWALRDVTFEVGEGEVVGVIGRNGAGKSTLLKLLSRISEPTGGRAFLRGRVASLLEVGTGFHPDLTGRENIALNGAVLGMRRAEVSRKFDEIVAFAEIEKFIDTPVKRYSSGMYMRLAFAVAAHLEPEILLVDEVLAVGDVQFQRKCLGKIESVAKAGRTILFVSHNMNAIQQLCGRALMLDGGRLVHFSDDVRGITREYMFAGREIASARWENKGELEPNPHFTPRSLEITRANGHLVDSPVANDEEVYVSIEGEIETMNTALTIGYAIYSETGELLYWSYQTDGPVHGWPKLERGICVLRSRVPSRILNEGVYRIELIGGLHCQHWISEPAVNAPSVDLVVQGGLSDSPYWLARRPGLLAPINAWQVSSRPGMKAPTC